MTMQLARTNSAAVGDDETWPGKIIWVLFAVLPLVISGQAVGVGLIDAWWNFALGRLMLEQHQLIVQDPFSFTPVSGGAINQQWLAQLIWATVYDALGERGVLGFRAIAVAVTALALWSTGRLLGASRRALVGASLLATCVITSNVGVRAQTLALPLAAVSLYALQRGGRSPWLVVPLTIIWANLHGSFPLAVAFALAFACGSLVSGRSRQALTYVLVAVSAGLATLLTPYGGDVWRYAVDLSSNDAMRRSLTEWGPTTLDGLTGKAFFVELAAGFAIIAWRRPHVPMTWLLLTVALAAFGLTAIRNVVWFGIVALPMWALLLNHAFTAMADHPTRGRALRIMAVALVAVVLTPFAGLSRAAPNLGSDVATPDREAALMDLADYLSAHPNGLLFHDADWGAYLEAHLYPAQRVFIDTRYEVHASTVWDDYYAVISGRFDWDEVLQRYGIQRIAVDPQSTPALADAIQASGRWKLAWDTIHTSDQIQVWARA